MIYEQILQESGNDRTLFMWKYPGNRRKMGKTSPWEACEKNNYLIS